MNERYSGVSIALHWAMAAVMIAAFVVGEVMMDLPRGPEKVALMGWHVVMGLMVAALLVPRLVARLWRSPDLPPGIPTWEKVSAWAGHLTLYAVMTVLPVLGLLALLSGRNAFPVLGLFDIPALFPSRDLHVAMERVHGAVAKVFLAVLVLHVVAAAWHALIRRDGIVERMMPSRR